MRVGNCTSCDGYAYQQVTIPAGAPRANLSYWWYMQTSRDQLRVWDHLYVDIRDTSGTLLGYVQRHMDGDLEGQWQRSTNLDLTPWAGQTVSVTFWMDNDVSYSTTFWVDDVSLETCPVPSVTPPVAPSNLQARPIPGPRVLLTWQDNSDDEDDFYVEISSDGGGSWPRSIAVGQNQQFTYDDVTCQGEYLYRVRAYRMSDGQYSDYSNEADAVVVQAYCDKSLMLISPNYDGEVANLKYTDEDILAWDPVTGVWYMVFDGSDVGLHDTDVDALYWMDDGTFLLSFYTPIAIAGLGTVDDSDIVRFTPTQLGRDTAGSFSLYLDGSTYGLDAPGEDIDAIGFSPGGNLVVSTLSTFGVPGASGLDEDLIEFDSGSGTWALYFDGSDVGLSESANEDVWGAWIAPVGGEIYLTTMHLFGLPNGLSGDGDDVFRCTPTSLGDNTACTWDTQVYWNAAAVGLTDVTINAFQVILGDMRGDTLLLTTRGSGSAGNVYFQNEDILGFDMDLGVYYNLFDGSDLGLAAADLDGLHLRDDGTLLLSLNVPLDVPGLGVVDDSDMLQFAGNFGKQTSGVWVTWFDGSASELDGAGEDIDAICFNPVGLPTVSTIGAYNVSGGSGQDEDMISWMGPGWSLYFDGSDVGLADSAYEDIWGAWIDPSSGKIYLTTMNTFAVPAGPSGDGADIFACTPTSTGPTTACTWDPDLFFDGSARGLVGHSINGFHVIR